MTIRISTHAALALALASSIAVRAAGQSPPEGTPATVPSPDSQAPPAQPAGTTAPVRQPPPAASPPATPAPGPSAPAPLQPPPAPRAPPGWPYPPAPVVFEGAEGQQVSIAIYAEWAKAGEVPPIVRCRTPCTLYMMPASYRVWVEETTDTLKGDRVITVNGPTRVTISPDPKSQRTIGLVLGITGPVFMVLGFVVFLSNITVYCDSSDTSTSCGSDVDPTLGLLMMLGGAAITPIGWVMFGKSMRPNMEVYSEAPAYGALERLRPRVGVVRTPGGAGLGAAISF